MADTGRPRIALVVDAAPPWSKGGRERRYAELLRRVSDDFDVTVYTMRWWRTRPEPGRVRYVAICPRMSLYRKGRRSVSHSIVFSLGTLLLLFRRFDVLYADHMPYVPLFPLRLVAWLRRVPLVVEWHERWSREYWQAYLGARAGSAAAAVERAALRMPDLIVADSAVLADELRDAVGERRLTVVTNAVDRTALATVEAADNAPDVLFVGRLIDHKRADVAIRALALMAERPSPTRLGVVGIGPERHALESLAHSLGLADRVVFFGSLDDDARVAALLRGAATLASPSEREGFGLTVAEALALGTPVVTVECPENHARLLVEEGATGSVVPAGDAASVAVALDGWLDRDEREQVRTAFWRAHPELDWDESARTFSALLRSLASS